MDLNCKLQIETNVIHSGKRPCELDNNKQHFLQLRQLQLLIHSGQVKVFKVSFQFQEEFHIAFTKQQLYSTLTSNKKGLNFERKKGKFLKYQFFSWLEHKEWDKKTHWKQERSNLKGFRKCFQQSYYGTSNGCPLDPSLVILYI